MLNSTFTFEPVATVFLQNLASRKGVSMGEVIRRSLMLYHVFEEFRKNTSPADLVLFRFGEREIDVIVP